MWQCFDNTFPSRAPRAHVATPRPPRPLIGWPVNVTLRPGLNVYPSTSSNYPAVKKLPISSAIYEVMNETSFDLRTATRSSNFQPFGCVGFEETLKLTAAGDAELLKASLSNDGSSRSRPFKYGDRVLG